MRIHPWICLMLSCTLLASQAGPAKNVRDWAQAVEMKGAPNLHQVSPTLYRSAQPSAQGIRNLKASGVKTVINLRAFHSDKEELKGSGLDSEWIQVKTWNPEKDELVRFLKVATDPKRAPVLVHCQHGADRTGAMCAVYRIAVEGWTKEEALREMTEGGFGFHPVWENLPEWIRNLDIESIRKEAGIKPVARKAK